MIILAGEYYSLVSIVRAFYSEMRSIQSNKSIRLDIIQISSRKIKFNGIINLLGQNL